MKKLVGIGALKRQYHQIGLFDIYNPKEGYRQYVPSVISGS